MFFDLQRFGGKGGTTIQSTYEPTEYELRLQSLEVELTEEVLIPSAKKLGQTAYNSFEGVTASIQDITNSMTEEWLWAKDDIDQGLRDLRAANVWLAKKIVEFDAVNTTDVDNANGRWYHETKTLTNDIEKYIHDQNHKATFVNSKIKDLPDRLSDSYDDLEDNLQIIGGDLNGKTVPSTTGTTSYNLSNVSTENYKDLDSLKPTLESALAVDFDDALNGIDKLSTIGSFYNNLDSLIPEYNENYQYARFKDTEHSNFNDLIDGKLPEQWKTNMKDAIKTTLENTIGEVVNDLGVRGVLNSSVTTQSLYDIERNAADEVGKMYLQNIQSVGGLVENRWQVKEQSLNDQKLVLNELWGYMAQAFGLKLQAKAHDAENKRAVALALAQIFTQQFSNSSNAFTQQAGMDTQKYSALNSGVNSQAQLYGELLNNQGKASANALNWYQMAKAFADTHWTHDVAPTETLMRLQQLRLQGFNTWANCWEAVLANTGRRIAIGSATQEALQQPALRMWNAATGLNQSATGVLVSLSNQGTRTQTQSSSGNFLGGILSAGLTAFAGGWGAGIGGAAFGQKQF